ncbi:MAG: purine-nucleoside phosphorylase [Prevotella sp.]|nr:purine-nucleoside phosphorylase [Prevotella sp.]
MYRKIQETTSWLKQQIQLQAPTASLPQIAIILGTGLGTLAEQIETSLEIPYKDIPNFPVSTVEGHDGKLIFGRLGGKEILAMKGRFHYYEGYSMKEVTFPVRVMYELGIKVLFVSNAAGGANASFRVGDLMIITDHINGFPDNPLRGANIPTGPRFPDMHDAYNPEYVALADSIAEEHNMRLVHGTYYGTQGPSYETPAEYKAFHLLGADAVGMSTVPEVIVARHCGIKVFGVSVITNMGISDEAEIATHEEVQEVGNSVQPRMTLLITQMLEKIEL